MEQMQHGEHAKQGGHYGRLLIMTVLSFLSMYALMYAMVNTFDNVYPNFNQFYMAALMTAPMIIFELLLMSGMYKNRKLNALILAASAVALIVSWLAIRQQSAISDQQFLRSMIPHHAGAILMCKENKLEDPGLQQLCANILSSQQSEIDSMKSRLD